MVTVPEHKGRTECTCEVCNKVFTVKNSLLRFRVARGQALPRFCTRKCKMQKDTSETKELVCPVYGKLFVLPGHRIKSAKNPCCSYKCMGEGRRTGELKNCAECGKEFYVSGHRLRRHKTYFCKNDCRLLFQFKNNKSWEGFVESSIEYRKLVGRVRKSIQAVTWKNAVISRDVACIECGSIKSLNAHHSTTLIKIIADNDFNEIKTLNDPRLTDVSLGKTLCGECHANHHGLQSRYQVTGG